MRKDHWRSYTKHEDMANWTVSGLLEVEARKTRGCRRKLAGGHQAGGQAREKCQSGGKGQGQSQGSLFP